MTLNNVNVGSKRQTIASKASQFPSVDNSLYEPKEESKDSSNIDTSTVKPLEKRQSAGSGNLLSSLKAVLSGPE